MFETYLAGIKAGEGRAQDFQEVASSSEGIIHVVVVGVRMVPMPVQYVVPHIQAVPGDVCWRVTHTVELVPKNTLLPAHVITS